MSAACVLLAAAFAYLALAPPAAIRYEPATAVSPAPYPVRTVPGFTD